MNFGYINRKLDTKDFILLFCYFLLFVFLITSPLFENAWLKKYAPFISAFAPLFVVHTSPLSVRFKSYKFSLCWLLITLAIGSLSLYTTKVLLIPLISLLTYHFLRAIYLQVYKREPITLLIGPGISDEFSRLENRSTDKKDWVFTMISFFVGMSILLLGLRYLN